MKEDVSFSQFCDNFSDTYRNNFTYQGKRALYDYLIDYEKDIGEELDCDIVSFCCGFTEYENLKELQNDYPDIESIDELRDNTQVIEIPDSDSFIILSY